MRVLLLLERCAATQRSCIAAARGGEEVMGAESVIPCCVTALYAEELRRFFAHVHVSIALFSERRHHASQRCRP